MAEILSERRRYSKTFDNGDGTFTLSSSTAPIHFRDIDGNFQEIDSRFIASDDPQYDWMNALNEFTVYFKNDISANDAIKFVKDDTEVSFTIKGIAAYDKLNNNFHTVKLPSSSSLPTINGRKITYTGVYTNVNFGFVLTQTGIKEFVEITDISDLPDPSTFGYDPGSTYVALITEMSSNADSMEDEIGVISTDRDLGIIQFKKSGVAKFYSPSLLGFGDGEVPNQMEKRCKISGQKVTLYHGVMYSDLITSNLPYVIDASVSVDIGVGGDDGYEDGGDAVWNATGTTLRIGRYNAGKSYYDSDIGLRFQGVAIPAGSTIDTASLTYIFTSQAGNTNVGSRVYGIAEDDCAAFSSGSRPSQRTKTTEYISWNLDYTVGAGNSETSGDMAAVVQEIVDRGGWASGQAMGFAHLNTETVSADRHIFYAAYENVTYNQPQLNVTYHATSSSSSSSVSSSSSSRSLSSSSSSSSLSSSSSSKIADQTISLNGFANSNSFGSLTLLKCVDGFGYFGMDLAVGKIAKLNLKAFARDSVLSLSSGKDYPESACSDQNAGYGYYGLVDNPDLIVKIDYSSFSEVTNIDVSSLLPTNNVLIRAVIDVSNQLAYFSTDMPTPTTPSRSLRIDLSDFTYDTYLDMGSGANGCKAMSIDLANGFLYHCSNTTPTIITKVDLSDFSVDSTLTLDTNEGPVAAAIIDTDNGFMYCAVNNMYKYLVKVNLSSFTRVGRITLSSIYGFHKTGFYADGYVYVADGVDTDLGMAGHETEGATINKVDVSTFTIADTTRFETGEADVWTSIYDPRTKLAYFGCYLDDPAGKIIRLNTQSMDRIDVVTLNSGENRVILSTVDTVLRGSWCFGHASGVAEDYSGELIDGTGTASVVGSGDDEAVCIDAGENWVSPSKLIGEGTIIITYDQYQTGAGTPGVIEYRIGATQAACEAASWNTYSVPFSNTGSPWVQVRFSKSA